jgi:hypothetical protein
LEQVFYFPSSVYTIDKPEFLESVTEVFDRYIAVKKLANPPDEFDAMVQTDNFFDVPRINPFLHFVSATAWNILDSQGFNMQNKATYFTEAWGQEHSRTSSMDQHVHPGAQIVGFYFLEVPENSSKVVIHDPRAVKEMSVFDEKDVTQVTLASSMVNFEPKKGMMVFTNGWLPHSFSRHKSDNPLKVVHFNLNIQLAPALPMANQAEVI